MDIVYRCFDIFICVLLCIYRRDYQKKMRGFVSRKTALINVFGLGILSTLAAGKYTRTTKCSIKKQTNYNDNKD